MPLIAMLEKSFNFSMPQFLTLFPGVVIRNNKVSSWKDFQ